MTMSKAQQSYTKYLSPLIGGKVTNIIIDESDPHDLYMGIVIQVGKRSYQLIALTDPEGNGAGFLELVERKAKVSK